VETANETDPGTADPNTPYRLERVSHRANPTSYQVFRGVRDPGAVGDGVTDDTRSFCGERMGSISALLARGRSIHQLDIVSIDTEPSASIHILAVVGTMRWWLEINGLVRTSNIP